MSNDARQDINEAQLGEPHVREDVVDVLGDTALPPRRRRTRPGRLLGRVAVVTGASSGIGRAIAREFAAEGADVALIARGEDGLEAAGEEARALGVKAIELPLDVADSRAVDAAADTVRDALGDIDIWVNNAMVSVISPAVEMTAGEFRRVIEVNYLGYVHGTLAALRHMRERDAGVIVQIGSALAYRSIPLQSAYCASKAAIRGFTDSLRSELMREESGIALTMIQLPAANTPQFEVIRNRMDGHPQPVPPIYQPEVIARAVVRAVRRPRREMWIGWSTTRAILGQRLIPGLLDRYLATHAWESQETSDLPEGHPEDHDEDNLEEPLPGDRGAHGPFDSRARNAGTQRWVRRHPGLVAAGAAVAGYLLLRRSHATHSPALDFVEHDEDHHHGTILRPEAPPDIRRRGGKAGSSRKSGSQ
jgi:NADP-dependent 3-hydroxy acid dehydrogenase YdfG